MIPDTDTGTRKGEIELTEGENWRKRADGEGKKEDQENKKWRIKQAPTRLWVWKALSFPALESLLTWQPCSQLSNVPSSSKL